MKKILLLASLAFALPAKAELVTYNFTGLVHHIKEEGSWVPESNVDGRKYAVGNKIKGTLTYNTDTKFDSLDTSNRWVQWAVYKQANAGNIWSLSFEESGLAFRFNYDTITTHVGTPDWLEIKAAQDNYRVSLLLGGQNALDGSLVIPSRLKPLSSYFYPGFSFEDSGVSVNASLTSLELAAPVPEPSTYAMLLAGLAGLGFIARRRQTRR